MTASVHFVNEEKALQPKFNVNVEKKSNSRKKKGSISKNSFNDTKEGEDRKHTVNTGKKSKGKSKMSISNSSKNIATEKSNNVNDNDYIN